VAIRFKQYEVVRVVAIRGKRFSCAQVHFERLPEVGDIGTILEIYETPELAFEVECSRSADGTTVWLEAMYPEELELFQGAAQ
jgi:hypothetical protein